MSEELLSDGNAENEGFWESIKRQENFGILLEILGFIIILITNN